jgi:flagellar FliJ protein
MAWSLETMKSRDTLIRLKRFHVDEKRRRVVQIETMIAEFDRMAADLDREVASEEQKAGISDLSHFAYPTYAKAARTRRDNLMRSADDLKAQLFEAQAGLGEAFEALKKVEILDNRERTADRMAEVVRDQAAMNELGLQRARI